MRVCATCDRPIDPGRAGDRADVPYAVCPGCQQAVSPTQQADPEFRRRARVRQFADTGRVWPIEALDQVPPGKRRAVW